MTTQTEDGSRLDLSRIARRVEAHSGIVFRPDAPALEIAVRDRLSLGGWSSAADYGAHLELPSGAQELQQLTELLVVTETSLFRQPAQLAALRESVLPEIERGLPAGEVVRIWSAATARGEEAYSLAAVALATLGAHRQVEVLGTDLSQNALALAERARYHQRAVSVIPPDYLEWAFLFDGQGIEPAEGVRAMVRLAHHNLAARPFQPPDASGRFHVIFCRNVLMYFAPATVRRVVAGLANQLLPGGLLFTGFAETLLEDVLADAPLELVQLPGTFAYRRSEGVASRRPVLSTRGPATVHPRQLSERPSLPDLLEKARSLAAADRVDVALEIARRTSSIFPTEAAPKLLLGVLASRAGLQDQARAAFEQATALDPLEPLGWVQLGAVLRESGDVRRSSQAYATAVTLLDRLPPERLVGEYAAGQLARMCRQQLSSG